MSISGLFTIGLSGVNAFSQSLETVSNNIANSQTTGFRRAVTEFSTLASNNAVGGGIEGGGVDATAQTQVSEQGAITRTSVTTNLAIAGNGFFVVSQADDGAAAPDELSFTRAGDFSLTEDGALENAGGFRLFGATITGNGNAAAGSLASLSEISIDAEQSLSAPTQTLTIAGQISQDTPIGEGITRQVSIINQAGVAQSLNVSLQRSTANAFQANIFAEGDADTPVALSLIHI